MIARTGVAVLLAATALLRVEAAEAQLSGEVRIWSWDIAGKALQDLAPAFEQAHPGVRIVVEDLGNQGVYDRGLAACAAGGAGMPDIYTVENNEAEVFWSRFPDCFADLAAEGVEGVAEKFPSFKLAELQVGEKLYAMPWDSGPVVYFYRRDILGQAAVDPASIETWEDFIAAGQKVAGATGGKVKMATSSAGTDDEWFRMLANAAGCGYFDDAGETVTLARPGCVEALETIKRLSDAGVLASGGWDEQIQLVKAGAVAGSLYGAWYEGTIRSNAPDQAGEWGVIPMPGWDAATPGAANLGGSALAVPASAKNKAAAVAFVRYALATPEGQIAMLKSMGLVPSLKAALDDPYVRSPQPYWGDQPIWTTVLAPLEVIEPARGTQYFQEAREIMKTTMVEYLGGEYDGAQEALEDAADQISGATGLSTAE